MNCFILSIINLALGIGLLGLSSPRIFKSHAIFSGAETNILSDLFLFIIFISLLTLDETLSPATLSFIL